MLKVAKHVRTTAEFLVVGICTVTFIFQAMGIFASLLGRHAAGQRDFVEYWAAGHLLVHRANPYEGDAILNLERLAGYPANLHAQIMSNPPWALPLVLPLGFLSPTAGELLWMLFSLVCLVASVRMIWVMHDRPTTQWNVLGYTFAPALSCLLAGQCTVFVLFGLVLFLRWHRSRPFMAGASLWLCMLKPHLFLPFGIVLLVWIIIGENYKVLAGTAVALGVSTAIALVLNPHVWTQYFRMMSASRIDRLNLPCLSILLRQHVWPHTLSVQCLPAAFGIIWALVYFGRHRNHWDWVRHGSLLLLVSVLVPPYTWFMDQAVLIPALLTAAYAARSRDLIAVLALMNAAILIGLFLNSSPLTSVYFLWTTPAYLAWYLWAVRRSDLMKADDSPSLAAGDLGSPAY